MKKFFTYLLAFAAVTTVISCSKDDGPEEPDPQKPEPELPEPTITWPLNDNSGTVDITDEIEVKIKVDVPAGIKTFKIGVESKVLNENGITEIDLIESSKSAVKSADTNGTYSTKSDQITLEDIVKMILGDAGSPKDKTSYTLDLTGVVLLINDLTTEESEHRFTVMIVDKNDKTATQAWAFRRVAIENGKDFTETVSDVNFDMVYVQGGTFMMGADEQDLDAYDNEKPAHPVTLSDYHIGKFEVTQKLWKAVMGNNPSRYQGDDLPVECVNWFEAQTFLTKLDSITGKKYALPTEAQWEYAARGGVKSMGYKYSGGDKINDVAWYNGNSNHCTSRIGTRQPNELGIYDMTGNVSEWCNDYGLGEYFDSSVPLIDPTGPSSSWARVVRGGSFCNTEKDCRVSCRNGNQENPGYGHYEIGFRVVLLPER